MRFVSPLLRARLIRRYKRFLADVELPDGATTTVHCPNPGAMLGLDQPGSEIWLSSAANPRRKLRYTWELVRTETGLVGINTGHPNRLAEEAIDAGRIAPLAGYARRRREVKYGLASRVDLLLEADDRPPCYVEVKNVHLRRTTAAEFPDCVTARGTKHLVELTAMVAAGQRAVMLYLVQRMDCDRFRIAADLDPVYARELARSMKAGVEALCHACRITTTSIEVGEPLPLDL